MTTQLTRRTFMRATALASLQPGCIGEDECDEADLEEIDEREACWHTPENPEGPYYRGAAPLRNDLAPAGTRGERLLLRGRVLDVSCAPLPGAGLDVWQADALGTYDLVAYRLRGRFEVEQDGSFELRSIRPGNYRVQDGVRAAHLHLKLHAPGKQKLTTQLYFADDPHNDEDCFAVDALIVDWRLVDGIWTAEYDFTLVDDEP